MHRRKSSLRGPLLALALTALALPGCLPGAAWLPDSSGIVYTAGKSHDRLFLYDLAKGEQKVLVADTGAPTFWPAVSPDGKRIAVARLDGKVKGKPMTLQIKVYGVDGKELRRSQVFPWTDKRETEPTDDFADMPQLFWSPRGDRVVVHAPARTALYDLKADRLLTLDDGLLLNFGGSPFVPDGTGFIVLRNVPGWMNKKQGADVTLRAALVDLEGKQRALKLPALLGDEKLFEKEKDVNKLIGLLSPVLYESGWEGDVAWVRWNVDRLRYFTKKGEAAIDQVEPVLTEDGNLIQRRQRFGSGAEVRVVALKGQGKERWETEGVRVEVVKAGEKKAQVVLARADFCILTPAPNGKLAAVRCLVDTKDRERYRDSILLVNERGELAANLHVPR